MLQVLDGLQVREKKKIILLLDEAQQLSALLEKERFLEWLKRVGDGKLLWAVIAFGTFSAKNFASSPLFLGSPFPVNDVTCITFLAFKHSSI